MKIGETASHDGCVGSWREGRAGPPGAGRQVSRVWREAWVWGLTEHHSEPELWWRQKGRGGWEQTKRQTIMDLNAKLRAMPLIL